MILFSIKFDETKAAQNGKTASELMHMVSEILAKESTTIRLSEYEWSDDSEDAMAIFGLLMRKITKDEKIFSSLAAMSWNVDGDEEDCIKEELEYRAWKRSRKR